MKINGYDTEEYEGFSLLEVDTMASQKMMDILLENPAKSKKPLSNISSIKLLPQT
jgi:hypothetical protein